MLNLRAICATGVVVLAYSRVTSFSCASLSFRGCADMRFIPVARPRESALDVLDFRPGLPCAEDMRVCPFFLAVDTAGCLD
jgi:hypothetical protein